MPKAHRNGDSRSCGASTVVQKYGFVYIWYDKKHKRYYIGAHWGSEDDGYICSSSWMKNSYKRRESDFKRRILKNNIQSKKELFLEEQKYLNMIKDEELGKKYYNLNKTWQHWSSNENKCIEIGNKISLKNSGSCLSKETKEKISKSLLGNKRRLGKPMPTEQRQRMKILMKGNKNNAGPNRYKWFTNGTNSIRAIECPVGYKRGRTINWEKR